MVEASSSLCVPIESERRNRICELSVTRPFPLQGDPLQEENIAVRELLEDNVFELVGRDCAKVPDVH